MISEKTQRTIIFVSIVLLAFSVISMCTISFVYMVSTPIDSAPKVYEMMWDIWVGRIVAFLFVFILLIFLPVAWFVIKVLDKKYIHIENMEIIKREQEASQPKIVLNKAVRNVDSVTINGLQITTEKISYFIKNAIDFGLAISAWREEGFTQAEIEAILDHLAELGVVTERSQGVSCTWRREIDTMRLARYFPIDNREVFK